MDFGSSNSTLLSPCTIWLTGLSGAGKTTIAQALKEKLDILLGYEHSTFILGNLIRKTLIFLLKKIYLVLFG